MLLRIVIATLIPAVVGFALFISWDAIDQLIPRHKNFWVNVFISVAALLLGFAFGIWMNLKGFANSKVIFNYIKNGKK